jgi:two-component system, LytTR family, sensor kinase
VTRYARIARLLIVLSAAAALIPLARLVTDWVQVSRMVTGPVLEYPVRSFDWVLWQEDEGVIFASYVFPRGPAAEAGISAGDIFYMLEYQQYFNAEDLKRVVEGIRPGSTRTYLLQRDGDFRLAEVRYTRYPTFIYPLAGTLWHFSIWLFLLGAFIHLLGLIIVGPLSLRSSKARFSLLLIFVSALWIFSNLVRLLLAEFFGPPATVDGAYDLIFQALTFTGLIGWIGFPALLVHKVLRDALGDDVRRLGAFRLVVYLPASILGAAALASTVTGNVGPLNPDALVAPILFYACCYIASAALLMLGLYFVRADEREDRVRWSRTGSAVIFLLAFLFGLSVLGVVPLFGTVTDTMAGWLIVSAQLLSTAPVLVVSHTTLMHGKVDQVLGRGLVYFSAFGFIFLAFVGGLAVMEPYLQRSGAPRNMIAGLYVLVLLAIFERVARRTKGFAASFLTTERHAMYQALSRFQEQMRTILDYEALVQRTVDVLGRALGARSAFLFLHARGGSGPWISSTYHPEPPYLTERVANQVWSHLSDDGPIWAANHELSELILPDDVERLLRARRAALIVPIRGSTGSVGLIVLGAKRRRRAVYNLEEVDLLRSFSSQLGLAIERLDLVERERALVRETAEAQLVALRAQINPHFLFNALNTIMALIEERPEEAEETVAHLAAIFRHTLQTGGQPFVPLEDELALVTHYLSVEQKRFGASLSVEQHLDASLQQHPVPAFAIQTLVENAVKHGLAMRRGGGTLRITCVPDGPDRAEVVVSDTGIGIPDLFGQDEAVPDPAFFGIGLRNISARLEQLYGRTDLLRFSSTPETGTIVRLILPHFAAPPLSEEDQRVPVSLTHAD